MGKLRVGQRYKNIPLKKGRGKIFQALFFLFSPSERVFEKMAFLSRVKYAKSLYRRVLPQCKMIQYKKGRKSTAIWFPTFF
jgi:hypothetical protein